MTEEILGQGSDESKAVLVAAGEDRQLPELGRLAQTLGLRVVGELEQGRRDGVGYVGRGKREELKELVDQTGAGLVVTDDELSPSQARVLEKVAGVTVVDRTLLIIRIFEAHARDAASRLEVELAELTYRLPRVRGGYKALSRLGGGGVTTRGPGEQQLEYDRRVIRERMERIRKRLEEERSARKVRGARLKRGGPPSVALVGYTNAGKTTILNALSGERRSTADRLFETLETTTRLVPGGYGDHENGKAGEASARPDFVLTDTVGFIKKLPTQLVHSFASTLEAAADADIIVLCADAGSEKLEEEIQTVRETLADTLSEVDGEGSQCQEEAVLCLNKSDIVSEDRRRELRIHYPESVLMSARRDASPLLGAINEALARSRVRMQLLIPHAQHGLVSGLYGRAEIHAREDTTQGTELDVTLSEPQAKRYENYRTA
ncbi:MAG: Ribosome LSU-associated GTP-binding protein HflX [uncultured Rubrobacteraceae bacterium]|uniref:GTPase HflX n=1 Tax=uncultured Rubrobacteraceae bacterium TaxID=349277 RepID=A0A6J4R1C2_9ACTN|nr:MAG: Ribosome LSU-associated GTP-binding protein HflX [uncultured Rubrobacteraceae bacterium]